MKKWEVDIEMVIKKICIMLKFGFDIKPFFWMLYMFLFILCEKYINFHDSSLNFFSLLFVGYEYPV